MELGRIELFVEELPPKTEGGVHGKVLVHLELLVVPIKIT